MFGWELEEYTCMLHPAITFITRITPINPY